MCNDRLHFCVVQERGSLSLHRGSVNWHGYTPSCSCPGGNQSTVSSGISVAHSTLGLQRGGAAHPIPIIHTATTSLLCSDLILLQLTDGSAGFATPLLRMAAARLGGCSGQ